MFLEWQTELFQKCISLFIRLGCSNECDFHSVNARVLVHVDFREDNLLLETECSFRYRRVSLKYH